MHQARASPGLLSLKMQLHCCIGAAPARLPLHLCTAHWQRRHCLHSTRARRPSSAFLRATAAAAALARQPRRLPLQAAAAAAAATTTTATPRRSQPCQRRTSLHLLCHHHRRRRCSRWFRRVGRNCSCRSSATGARFCSAPLHSTSRRWPRSASITNPVRLLAFFVWRRCLHARWMLLCCLPSARTRASLRGRCVLVRLLPAAFACVPFHFNSRLRFLSLFFRSSAAAPLAR